MTRIEKSALVGYSDAQMFHLVNDVESYPMYMDGCVGSEVIERTDIHMVARLELSKAGISQSFTTRNQLTPHREIILQLEDGPFSRFRGSWQFIELKSDACKIVFELEFDVKQKIVKKAVDTLFNSVANNMVDSLTKRAGDIYG